MLKDQMENREMIFEEDKIIDVLTIINSLKFKKGELVYSFGYDQEDKQLLLVNISVPREKWLNLAGGLRRRGLEVSV